uniref:OBP1 protein n=1 Tax=Conogethes punctiferalis TaxID=1133088 RepID=A0A0C4K6E3_CONPF|nr:odorant binding protein 1 [Conogethes punctiferalis]
MVVIRPFPPSGTIGDVLLVSGGPDVYYTIFFSVHVFISRCLANKLYSMFKIKKKKKKKGQFKKKKPVMCYITCIYQMMSIVKNNKLNYKTSIKQVDMMYPNDLKESVKKSIENCKSVSDPYKDICEASYWTAQCIYEDNPKDFIFA